MSRLRLDARLVADGLADDLRTATGLVLAGEVLVDDRCVDKPGTAIKPGAHVRLRRTRGGQSGRFVSRGGDKIESALVHFELDVRGLRAVDIGAATGGFTDALLQRGASEVVAIDVGYGLLADKLRRDPRVHVRERTNARSLEPTQLPFVPDLVVVDASFIGLSALLPAINAISRPGTQLLAMVKPQFELPPAMVPEGGVVRDDADRQRSVDGVVAQAGASGWRCLGQVDSAVHGPSGNIEIFVWLRRSGEGGQP